MFVSVLCCFGQQSEHIEIQIMLQLCEERSNSTTSISAVALKLNFQPICAPSFFRVYC